MLGQKTHYLCCDIEECVVINIHTGPSIISGQRIEDLMETCVSLTVALEELHY